MQVGISRVKANFSRFVCAVESGEEKEIIITRNGKPVARLMAVATDNSRKPLGFLDGKYPPMSLEDLNSSDEEIAEAFYSGGIFPES